MTMRSILLGLIVSLGLVSVVSAQDVGVHPTKNAKGWPAWQWEDGTVYASKSPSYAKTGCLGSAIRWGFAHESREAFIAELPESNVQADDVRTVMWNATMLLAPVLPPEELTEVLNTMVTRFKERFPGLEYP